MDVADICMKAELAARLPWTIGEKTVIYNTRSLTLPEYNYSTLACLGFVLYFGETPRLWATTIYYIYTTW